MEGELENHLPLDSSFDSQDVRLSYVFVWVALAKVLEHYTDLDRRDQNSKMVYLRHRVIDTDSSGGLGLEESYCTMEGHQVVLLGLVACLCIDQVMT